MRCALLLCTTHCRTILRQGIRLLRCSAMEETAYWLRLLVKADLIAAPRLESLLAETSELTAIFVASVCKLKSDTIADSR